MYTLEGDRVMYVPPIVRAQIQKLGIGRGEQFQVMKRDKKVGNRRTIEWVVERPGTGEPASPQGGKPNGEAASHGPDASGTAESTMATPVNGAHKPNGNGAAAAAIPFAGTIQGQYILSALVNMVDLVTAVEVYAKAKGRELQFTSEDIRALTITCFIQRARENGGAR
jgi:hypothetical protein